MTLCVVTFKWTQPGYHSVFTAEHVNVLAAMVKRHYPKPHKFCCVTDDPKGLSPDVRPMKLWADHGELMQPVGRRRPSCYRRLKLFSREARELFGERIAQMDLDMVVTADLSPLFDRPEPFVIWGDTHPRTFYNGSFFLLTTGAFPEVWEDFDPKTTPQMTHAAGFLGSDQAWISYRMGAGRPTFGQADGIYSYRVHIASRDAVARQNRARYQLPQNARLVSFHGKINPWSSQARSTARWISEHWKL